jgi:tripartite-type tricarboxylate transporter receptor subunit TctC
MRRRQLVQLAAAGLAAPAFMARAQAFPSKPIRLQIAFPAGGPTDITMRSLADSAGKLLGQPVVVENRPGAGGTLPAQALQTAAPDGYTLAQIPLGVFRLPYTTKINWDPVKDIAYVLNVTGYAFGLVVPTDSPLKTWAQFVAYAKANPGKLSYGSTGTLTSPHLTMELIAQQLGIELLHVPYKGSADLMQSIMGGKSWRRPTPQALPRRSKRASCACSTPGASSAWPSSLMRPRSKSWAWAWCKTHPLA